MRLFLILASLIVLAACTPTQPVSFDRLQPGEIRPGLTAAQVSRIQRAPTGLRRVWQFSGGETYDALRPLLDVRLTRVSGGARWDGNLKFRLPGNNVREIARQIEEATGRRAPIQGNFALVPVLMGSDVEGRITRFRFLGEDVSYTPHDCQNVVGTCRSVWRSSNGQVRKVVVETTERGVMRL